ncbi:hypothetical protein F4818DRAFT_127985 [Hypoxylon cercidicola]|nr:hypothetical protein F4818DRAFT_127985 [Hypoxylon cercidicola]
MRFHNFLFGPILMAASGLARRAPLPRAITISLPPPPVSDGFPSPGSTSSLAPALPSGAAAGPKCGKGYTYCGYMLTANGHNFAPNDISKAYCSGLSELCTTDKFKTDVQQAVFVCMNDQPSNIELLCACSGKCRNDAESNFIAHCDKPCING